MCKLLIRGKLNLDYYYKLLKFSNTSKYIKTLNYSFFKSRVKQVFRIRRIKKRNRNRWRYVKPLYQEERRLVYKSYLLNLSSSTVWYSKFFGSLIKSGKSTYVFNFLSNFFFFLKRYTGLPPFIIFNKVFKSISPIAYYRRIRRGRNFIKIPRHISKKKKLVLAIKWMFLVLKQKNRSFTIFDLLNLFLDMYINDDVESGLIYAYEKKFYESIMDNTYLLRYYR